MEAFCTSISFDFEKTNFEKNLALNVTKNHEQQEEKETIMMGFSTKDFLVWNVDSKVSKRIQFCIEKPSDMDKELFVSDFVMTHFDEEKKEVMAYLVVDKNFILSCKGTLHFFHFYSFLFFLLLNSNLLFFLS